jgi:hypothetical protein
LRRFIYDDDVKRWCRSKELVAASSARGCNDLACGKNLRHGRKFPLLELFAQQLKFLFSSNYDDICTSKKACNMRARTSLAAERSAPPPFPRFFLKESTAAAISDFMSPTSPLLSEAASMTSKLFHISAIAVKREAENNLTCIRGPAGADALDGPGGHKATWLHAVLLRRCLSRIKLQTSGLR